jgi:hypothetical protein
VGKEAIMGLSVTVDDLDAETLDRLRAEATRRGVDVGTVIKQMIRDELRPVAASGSAETHHELDSLAGTWSADEARAFVAATAELRKLDEDLWK